MASMDKAVASRRMGQNLRDRREYRGAQYYTENKPPVAISFGYPKNGTCKCRALIFKKTPNHRCVACGGTAVPVVS